MLNLSTAFTLLVVSALKVQDVFTTTEQLAMKVVEHVLADMITPYNIMMRESHNI